MTDKKQLTDPHEMEQKLRKMGIHDDQKSHDLPKIEENKNDQ